MLLPLQQRLEMGTLGTLLHFLFKFNLNWLGIDMLPLVRDLKHVMSPKLNCRPRYIGVQSPKKSFRAACLKCLTFKFWFVQNSLEGWMSYLNQYYTIIDTVRFCLRLYVLRHADLYCANRCLCWVFTGLCCSVLVETLPVYCQSCLQFMFISLYCSLFCSELFYLPIYLMLLS